jgi:uncharacterized repeat protein (TIGR01451 family)
VLTVTAPTTGVARHQLTYMFKIVNNGPATATKIVLSTKLIAGGARLLSNSVKCVAGIHLVCAVGTLAPGSSVVVTIVLRARGAAPYRNTASVVCDQTDPSLTNDSLTAKTTVKKTTVSRP